jgi:2-succinyl-5-enolpyruvyl-6-hydroxy-3-cyclohexene-1-carboxylate synthase
MLSDRTNLNFLWSQLIIQELIRNGIDYFCISPGSRSTPLTVGAARDPHAHTAICHDERGAAFHALGYARARGRSAVLICTSGTAAANYYPAVIEAAIDRVPMLILSADRPPELQQTGANQTIQQHGLFGNYTKWYFDIPCPSASISARVLLTTIDQALYQAHVSPAGPVHLNLMFREPLEPFPQELQGSDLADLQSWLKSGGPFTRYEASVKMPESAAMLRLVEILTTTERGIISIGRLDSDSERKAVLALIRKLQWPAFIDILSGLRLGFHARPIVPYFGQLLLAKSFWNSFNPETIFHVGGEMTSKRLLEFGKESKPRNHVILKDHPFRHDAFHNATQRLDADIKSTCQELVQHRLSGKFKVDSWLNSFLLKSRMVQEVIDNYILTEHNVSEISVAFLVSQNISRNQGLWLASSMPVRDMDMYGSSKAHPVRIGSNRGASGVEGTIASATGFARGLGNPVTLIIGDIAFLHDINSLYLIKKCPYPLTIIVINNNGGGIFSFLPIAKFQDVFEEYFATPHDLIFKPIVEMFAIDYFAPQTNAEFVEVYRRAISADHSSVLEISSDRGKNYQLHQNLQQMIVEKLENR